MALRILPRFHGLFGTVVLALLSITGATAKQFGLGQLLEHHWGIMGATQCWGDKWIGGDCTGMDFKGVTDVYSTPVAFMALNKVTGKAQCWGDKKRGGDCIGMDFQGVTDVYSTGWFEDSGAFMALNKVTGEAQCWGWSFGGGDCTGMDFKGVTDVYSTGYAFMALNKITGKAQCWGDKKMGGDCTGMDFKGVTDVHTNANACMALDKVTGKAQCWGDKKMGGDCTGMDFKGVTDVYSTAFAFMALNKVTGKAQCWGLSFGGGDCTGMDFTGVTDVYSTGYAFMVLNKVTGKAQCWGWTVGGGDCTGMDFKGVTDVYSTGQAFMALNKITGKALCWGDDRYGGDCFDGRRMAGMDFTGVTDVYSTFTAFMALNNVTRKAQCWGWKYSGGDCTGMDFKGVTDVYSAAGAFMALSRCPPNSSAALSNLCSCDVGFHGKLTLSPHDSMYVGQCIACSGSNEYQDEPGAEQCKRCSPGYFGIPVDSHPHTACNDDKCELPTSLPPHVTYDPKLCPSDGHLADGSRNASFCYLQCEHNWHSSHGALHVAYACSPDSATTASYQGNIECEPDNCPSSTCKNNGTLIGGDLVHGCNCNCSEGWLGEACDVQQTTTSPRIGQALDETSRLGLGSFALVGISILVGIAGGSCISTCIAWRALSHGEFHICGMRIKKGHRFVALGARLLRRMPYIHLPVGEDQRDVEFSAFHIDSTS